MPRVVDRVLDGLRHRDLQPKLTHKGWTCRCPAHDDRNPSLSISEGADGRALVCCFKGCTAEAIVSALGLTLRDLMPNGDKRGAAGSRAGGHTKPKAGSERKQRTFATAVDAVHVLSRTLGAPAAEWAYTDASGSVRGLVVRWNGPGGKEVRPVSRNGRGWYIGGMPSPRPLYRLPDLAGARRVYVCEGEPAADAARTLGLVATTSPHGAGSAREADWAPTAGCEVVILPDRDDAGERYAADVTELSLASGACMVRVVRLPGLPSHGDMVDFLALRRAEGVQADAIRAEVEKLADSAEPIVAGPVVEAQFAPIRVPDLIRAFPEMRPPVVLGLLRRGETMNLIAAPKVGKSWLAHSLVCAVALGRPWLGMSTTGGRVLLIDAELHRETLAQRLGGACKALGIEPPALANVEVWAVRGRGFTIDHIAARLSDVPAGEYALVVLDALYRFLPADGEENSNEQMTRVYNTVDALAEQLQAAVVLVHHTSKGSQHGKLLTDVGAGGGAQSRAADTHLILRSHEQKGAVVVEAAVRSWKPLEPFVIRWLNPGWIVAPDLDPTALLQTRRQKRSIDAETAEKPRARAWTVEDFAEELVGRGPRIREDIIAAAREAGLSKAEAASLLKRAEEAGAVHRVSAGPSARPRFSTQPNDPNVPPGGKADSTTPPPERCAPGGVGGRA